MPSAFDIHFQLQSDLSQGREAVFTFAYTSAVGVRGFQKTINQWMKCLLTPKGTDPVDRTYGTDFADLLTSNTFSATDVVERATLAIDDCNAQVLAFQKTQTVAALPNEERLASASILSVEETDTSAFAVYVLLKNVLNQGVQYVLPTL